jgi:pimeloyl-ACP methyl ester carboxylesterase
MASWRAAREVVLPTLHAARAKYPGHRVHLIGHSLGGAVAALAALELRLGLRWRDVVVTTFGEPRVGNKELAGYVERAFGLDSSNSSSSSGSSSSSRSGEDGEGKGKEAMRYRRVTHVGDPVPLLPLSEWGYRAHGGEVYIGRSELPPGPEDLRLCEGADDPECMGGAETEDWLDWVLGWMRRAGVVQEQVDEEEAEVLGLGRRWFPARFKLWQLFFAHRDYFWRLGLCVPGGDPADWGREKYNLTLDESTGSAPELRDL